MFGKGHSVSVERWHLVSSVHYNQSKNIDLETACLFTFLTSHVIYIKAANNLQPTRLDHCLLNCNRLIFWFTHGFLLSYTMIFER